MPGAVLLQITRNLKKIARSLLIYLGESATVTQTVEELEVFYEIVSSDESLIQGND